MKKVILCTFMLGIFAFAQAQEEKLDKAFKIELGHEGISTSYEYPIAKKWLAVASLGFGGSNDIRDNGVRYVIAEGSNRMAFFGQGQLRYYWDRAGRAKDGFSTLNNSGAFLGFQTKYNQNDPAYGKAWINNVHIGQQLPMSNRFTIRYYAGVCYGYNLDRKIGKIYSEMGLNFSFVLF